MNFVTTSRFAAFLVLSIGAPELSGCGTEFTCADDATCAAPNTPDGSAGTGGRGGTAGTSGGSSGTAGSAGSSGGSAGSSGGSAGSSGSAGGSSTDAAMDGHDAADSGADAEPDSCTPGSEGCACTPARGCNTGLVCRGTTCAKTVCGDARVEGTEFCDDGENLGAKLGDCAPDCTATVVQKKILMSAQPIRVDLASVGPVLTTVDAYCPNGYKALFAFGSARVATVTPNVGNGQVNWVLRPWTRYVNATGSPVWLTNKSALLGVAGGTFRGLTNPIAPSAASLTATGMAVDWTTLSSLRTCSNWTMTTGDLDIGDAQRTNLEFLNTQSLYPCSAAGIYHVYCVEQ
jgi:hypothetical protein